MMIYEPTAAEIFHYGGYRHSHLYNRKDPSLCGSITRGLGYRNLAGRMAAMVGGGTKPFPFRILTIQQDHLNEPVTWVESEFNDMPSNCVAVRLNDVGNSRNDKYFMQAVSLVNGVFNASLRNSMANIATVINPTYYSNAYAGDKFAVLPINESSELATGEVKSTHDRVEFSTFMDYEFGECPDDCWIVMSNIAYGNYMFFGSFRFDGNFLNGKFFRDGLRMSMQTGSGWAGMTEGDKYFIVDFSQT